MTREEAIKVIKENESEYSPRIREAIEVLAPELGESRKERIKISLIDFLDDIWHLGKNAHFDRYTTADCADWINWVKKQGKNNMGISEATKQKLEDSLNNSLEKETPESWNKFLEEQDEQEDETEQKDALDMPLIEIPFGAKDSELIGATYYIPEGFHAEIDGNKVIFKQGEQQPAWSEEDEVMLGNALWACKEKYCSTETYNWLKSLRERVQYQPKQESGGKTEADEYIDLGLPSGTLWKSVNEEGYYTYNEAVEKFQSRLPQKYQCEELAGKCKWEWKDNGYKVTGPNGKSIFLPAAGFCYGRTVLDVDKYGLYWTSTYSSDASAYVLGLYDDHIFVDSLYRTTGRSVRLVK